MHNFISFIQQLIIAIFFHFYPTVVMHVAGSVIKWANSIIPGILPSTRYTTYSISFFARLLTFQRARKF